MVSRRWLKIGGGVAATITTILGLFGLLSTLYGFEIVDLTGDLFCEGTYENPCISEFEVRNPNAYNVDIYSKDQVKLDFSPEIEDWALFVPDGRCSATGKCACDLKNGDRLGFEDWRCVDFTNKTKPRADKVYNFRFGRYSTTEFRLAGIKKNPGDTIKWAFGTNEKELDPIWKGIDKDTVFVKLLENKADFTKGEAIFEVYNPFSKDISPSELDFIFTKARGNDIQNYKIFINATQTNQIPQYETVVTYKEMKVGPKEINDTSYDPTENLTKQVTSNLTGYRTEYVEVFKPIDSIPLGTHKIKLTATWKPTLGNQRVDWKPRMSLSQAKYSELDKDITLTKNDWAWWNMTWKQRRPINISENQQEGNLSNYQVDLFIDYTTGMNSDFSDLRFTWVNKTDSEEYEIAYWKQEIIESDNSTFWVKVPTLYNATNTTVFMYWDNDAASSTSNFSATFKFESIWNNTIGMGPGRILNTRDGYVDTGGVADYGNDKIVTMPSFKRDAYTDDTAFANITYLNRTTGAMVASYQSANTASDGTGSFFELSPDGFIYETNVDVFQRLEVHKFNETADIEWSYVCSGAGSNCEYAASIEYINDTAIIAGGYYGSGGGTDHSVFMLDSDGNEVWANIGVAVGGIGFGRDYAFDKITERVYIGPGQGANPEQYDVDGFDIADGALSYADDTPHVPADSRMHAADVIDGILYRGIEYDVNGGTARRIALGKLNITGATGVELENLNLTTVESTMGLESMEPVFNGNIMFLIYYDYTTDENVLAVISLNNHIDGNMTLIEEHVLHVDPDSKQGKDFAFTNGSLFASYYDGSDNDAINISYTRHDIYEHVDQEPTYIFGAIESEDTTPPTYSNNITSSTVAGTAITHSLRWQDLNNTGGPSNLSSFIFSWHNGTNWTYVNSTSDIEPGTQSFFGEGGGGGNTTLFFDGAEGWTLDTNCPSDHPWTSCSTGAAFIQSLDSSSVSPNTIQSGSRVIGMWDIDSSGEATSYLKLNNDTTGFDEVWITFWTNTGSGNDGQNEACYVQASTTDSGYTKIWNSWDEGWFDSTWHYKELNLTAYQSTTTWSYFSGRPTFTRPNNEWCDWDNVTLKGVDYGGGGSSEDVNKTPVDYLDVTSESFYEVLDNITVTVNVDYYNTSGSINNGNGNATLWLEIYNGSGWFDEGDFSVIGTGDFSKTVTTASVLNAWNIASNRNIRISARLIDYSTSSMFDTINWSSVIVNITSEQEFLDDSEVNFNVTYCPNNMTVCWSNVTKTVISTVGATIKWKVRGTDIFDNFNQSEIFSYLTTEAGADTCTYSSGNWNVDCSDNCVISSNITIDSGNNISMTGSGIFTINNGIKISGWTYRYADRSCYVKAFGSGGFFQ